MLWHQLIACTILALALTQLHCASSQTAASKCSKNFTQVGDQCLLAVNSWFSWYEADRYCHTKGAGLLSLKNDTQLQLINKWLNTSLANQLELWTSGNSLGQKGVYFWQNTGEQSRYLPWATGQPRTTDGDCLMLTGTYSGLSIGNYRLSIRNCSTWAVSVCEQQAQNLTTRICLKPEAFQEAQVVV
ncbi:C-type lectin 37Db-like [Drosophila montana]|uniref:C-type lectin 37Db-like n=1 Tax=Drosophila montana TaxID=40370 RepID=UPI00313B201F